MERALFDRTSVHDYKQGLVREVRGVVEAMPDKAFADRSAEELLRKALERLTPKVANLDVANRSGKRTTSSRVINGAYRTFDVIAVSIPVIGDMQTLDISPSSTTLGCRGEFSHQNLVLTYPDDERLEGDLNSAIQTISNNLDQLARDLSGMDKHLIDVGNQGIESRRAELKRQRDLDAGRSFPIK